VADASSALFQYRLQPPLDTTFEQWTCEPSSATVVAAVPELFFANEIVSSQPPPLLTKRATTARATAAAAATTTVGPDPATKPDYDNLVGPLGRFMDGVFLRVFRDKLAEQVLGDVDNDDVILNGTAVLVATPPPRSPTLDRWLRERSHRPANYTDIVELAAALNARFGNNPVEVTRRARRVLQHLFPSWLPAAYATLFSQPFPALAARMNARVTAVAGVWLMGECTVNDVEPPLETGTINSTAPSPTTTTTTTTTTSRMMGRGQGVLVTRCRFLEESQCASVCVNSCKLPTQSFFLDCMGLPLVMEPDYATGSCQFSFGRLPNAETERAALATPCLSQCPTAGSYRMHHSGGGGHGRVGAVESRSALSALPPPPPLAVSTRNLDDATMPNDDEDVAQVDSLTTATTCYMMGTTQS
jgi:Beta-carotene isomerase D27-like, C-terminal